LASSALAVTIVGSILAFVFGYAGQQVAREWQETDRRLEVRAALARHVSDASAGYLEPKNSLGRYSVLDALLKAPPNQPDPVYETSLRNLLDELQRRSDDLIAAVLAAKLTI